MKIGLQLILGCIIVVACSSVVGVYATVDDDVFDTTSATHLDGVRTVVLQAIGTRQAAAEYLKDMMEQYKKMERFDEDRSRQLDQMHVKYQKYRINSDVVSKAVSDLESMIEQQEQQLRKFMDSTDDDKTALQSKLVKALQDLSHAKESLEKADKEVEEARERYNKLLQSLEECQAQHGGSNVAMKKKLFDMREQQQMLDTDVQKMRKGRGEMVSKVRSLEKTIKDLQEDDLVSQLDKAVKEEEERLHEMVGALRSSEETLQKLTKEAATRTESRASLTTKRRQRRKLETLPTSLLTLQTRSTHLRHNTQVSGEPSGDGASFSTGPATATTTTEHTDPTDSTSSLTSGTALPAPTPKPDCVDSNILKATTQDIRERVSNLQDAIKRMCDEAERLKQAAEELGQDDGKLDVLKQQVERLREEQQSLSARRGELEEQLATLMNKFKDAEESRNQELKQLREEYEATMAAITKATQDVEASEQELETLLSSIAGIESAASDCGEFSEEMKQLEDSIRRLRSDAEQLEGEHNEMERERSELESQAKEIARGMDEQEQELRERLSQVVTEQQKTHQKHSETAKQIAEV